MTDTRCLPNAEVTRENAARFLDAHRANRDRRLEALEEICQRKRRTTLVVSTFNAGFGALLWNWAASCDAHGIDCRAAALLFPTDEKANRLARALGFDTFYDGRSFGEQPEAAAGSYGDGTFVSCMFAQTAAVQDVLELGYDVLLQDVDMVWIRNPIPLLEHSASEGNWDMQFMYDGVNARFQPLYYNSGFCHIVNNEFSRTAWSLVHDSYDRVLHYQSQQTVVNIVVNCLRERGLRTCRLPEHQFVNGHVIVEANRDGRPLPEEKVVVHASWTENLGQKVERLRRHGLWYVEGAG